MSVEFIVGKAVDHAPGLRTYIGSLAGDPDFARPSLLPRGGDRKTAVVNELVRATRSSMDKVGPQLDALKAAGLLTSYEVNPLSHSVVVDVPDARAAEAYKALGQVDGLGRMFRNREIKLAPMENAVAGAVTVERKHPADEPPAPTKKVEWNVTKVNAPDVWAAGFTGQGVTVGIVDTGVDFTHPDLAAKYRGLKADGSIDNNYNWFDAVNKKTAPYDDNHHGSHVTGTVLGSTPDGTYDTGVAPGAKFIASKILSGSGSGTLEGVMKGLQWMLAPTDSAGANPDPTKAPDIISNSWGTTNGKMDTFRTIMKAFLAAGIEPVFAAGNAGPRPGSVGAPGSYPEVISVAATDKNDKVASFSSRGPSPIKGDDGSDHKPDVAAPGVDVISSVPGGGYQPLSGTSMATPAVSGVVALLLSKHHDLTHAEIVKALTTSAHDLGTAGYDYDYGAGLVDAKAALAAADKIVADRTPPTPPPTPPAQP